MPCVGPSISVLFSISTPPVVVVAHADVVVTVVPVSRIVITNKAAIAGIVVISV